jgi:hypothetical protein
LQSLKRAADRLRHGVSVVFFPKAREAATVRFTNSRRPSLSCLSAPTLPSSRS